MNRKNLLWSVCWAVCLVAACAPSEPPPESGVASEPSTGEEAPFSFDAVEVGPGIEPRLQAVSVVEGTDVVWVSGLEGTWGRSIDGGSTWEFGAIEGAEELQLRDIHGVDAEGAFALSAGPGEASRIFRTEDGGATWTLQWTMPEPEGFLDCFDFWSPEHGMAYGDSIDGALYLLETTDGATWARLPAAHLPAAAGKEGGFAASGTCLRVDGDGSVWVGTGAGDRPRLLVGSERGAEWRAVDLPTVAGPSAGIFSLVLGDGGLIGVFGGDLEQADGETPNVAWSFDRGANWSLGESPGFPGAIYGADLVATARGARVAVAGPSGVDLGGGPGTPWIPLSRDEYWAIEFLSEDVLLTVGPQGRITRFELRGSRLVGG